VSLDPLVEAVTQRLDLIYSKADALVKDWFPDLTDSHDRRITILAVIKQLVTLMQIEAGSVTPTKPPETPVIPAVDTADIDALVWTTYKTKQKAEPGQAAWTFSDPERHDNPDHKRTVKELVKAIKGSENQRFRIGDMEYSFSGNEKQFISRRPIRRK